MMRQTLAWMRDNPVAVLDLCKAVTAVLAAVGVPITSGMSGAVGALVIAVLAIATQKVVSDRVAEALNTPAPEEPPASIGGN